MIVEDIDTAMAARAFEGCGSRSSHGGASCSKLAGRKHYHSRLSDLSMQRRAMSRAFHNHTAQSALPEYSVVLESVETRLLSLSG